jgi:hypothetical protein
MTDRSSSPPNGFFIPYPHAAEAVPAGYPGLRPLFAAAEAAFRAGVVAIDAYAAGLDHIARGGPGLVGERPARFEQEWFPGLDAAAAYAMVRQARPRRIIEIGSGHSTRFLAQAIVDSGLATDLVCIDPQPRAPLTGLPLRHAARLFAPADALAAAELEAGDILFVDSSHVALPGTDVDRLLLDVLPRLRDGVLIHFHDIFLPDGYPEAWARRGYNEQIAVGALMLGGGYTPVFASHYVINYTNFLAGTVVERLPQAPGGYQASLWLRKGIV